MRGPSCCRQLHWEALLPPPQHWKVMTKTVVESLHSQDSWWALQTRSSLISRRGLTPTELTEESCLLPVGWPVTINYGHREDESEGDHQWLLREGEEAWCLFQQKVEQSISIVSPTSTEVRRNWIRLSHLMTILAIGLQKPHVSYDVWCLLTHYDDVVYRTEIPGYISSIRIMHNDNNNQT